MELGCILVYAAVKPIVAVCKDKCERTKSFQHRVSLENLLLRPSGHTACHSAEVLQDELCRLGLQGKKKSVSACLRLEQQCRRTLPAPLSPLMTQDWFLRSFSRKYSADSAVLNACGGMSAIFRPLYDRIVL